MEPIIKTDERLFLNNLSKFTKFKNDKATFKRRIKLNDSHFSNSKFIIKLAILE